MRFAAPLDHPRLVVAARQHDERQVRPGGLALRPSLPGACPSRTAPPRRRTPRRRPPSIAPTSSSISCAQMSRSARTAKDFGACWGRLDRSGQRQGPEVPIYRSPYSSPGMEGDFVADVVRSAREDAVELRERRAELDAVLRQREIPGSSAHGRRFVSSPRTRRGGPCRQPRNSAASDRIAKIAHVDGRIHRADQAVLRQDQDGQHALLPRYVSSSCI